MSAGLVDELSGQKVFGGHKWRASFGGLTVSQTLDVGEQAEHGCSEGGLDLTTNIGRQAKGGDRNAFVEVITVSQTIRRLGCRFVSMGVPQESVPKVRTATPLRSRFG